MMSDESMKSSGEEDSSGDSSGESNGESDNINDLYLQVPDVDYWIDKSKEISLRWQVENDFVSQLRNDPILRQVFDNVIYKRTKYSAEMKLWYNSVLYTISRAFINRSEMGWALIREAKNVEQAGNIQKKDERMLAIKDELEAFSTNCTIFIKADDEDDETDDDDDADIFRVLSKKANATKIEFTKWLSQPEEKEEEVKEEDAVLSLKTPIPPTTTASSDEANVVTKSMEGKGQEKEECPTKKQKTIVHGK